MWQENSATMENASLKGSIRKLKQAVFTLTSPLRLAARRMRNKHLRSQRRWLSWPRQAGICPACLSHTAHIIVISLWLFSPMAHAETPKDLAVKAIIAEAGGEPFQGMVAVGEAIRNRGSLQGVYGLQRASFISHQPQWVHEQARRAWMKSAHSDLVKGAQFWESTDFPTPKWAKQMTETIHIGKHKFYREVRK